MDIDPENEHNLYNLYNLYGKLPNEKKEWLLRMYNSLEFDLDIIMFENEIKKWSKSFVKIRYYHDCTNKDEAYFDFSNFIPNLAIALNNAYIYTVKYKKFNFPQIS